MTDGDEMVFDEVRLREPVRMRRPDRDPRRACLAVAVPRADDLPIFIERKPADAIERHALSDTSVELGGILLGKECLDDETGEPFVWITEALEAKHYENTQASFTYTHDSWEEITRERDKTYPDLDIVGWYHTHPDFGIFLSSHDLFIHHNFFSQPLQIAYVVDPIRQIRGFFQWRDGGMAAVRGFFLSGERSDRVNLSRLANDFENISNPEGTGSLSPRLEAELIAMLSRPQSNYHSDRGLAPALFGAAGALFGVFAALLVFWVMSLGQEVRDQADALARIEAAQKAVSPAAGDSVSIKERALDAMLADVKVGTPPEGIRALYQKALEEAEALRRRVNVMATEKDALALHADTLKRNLTINATDFAEFRKQSEEAEQRLKERLSDSQNEVQDLRNKAEFRDRSEGDGSRERGVNLTLWLAVGGWLACVLSLIALGIVWSRRTPLDDGPAEEPAVAPRLSDGSPDPHVIR